MKAVLVGTIAEDKLYYIIDASHGEEDGAIEREDGSAIQIDFMSFVATARGINKIRSSKFHRQLWDSPKNLSSGKWFETFIKKTIAVDEATLESSPVYSSIGKGRKKSNTTAKKASDFKKNNPKRKILNKSHNDSVIKFNEQEYSFNSALKRRDAWAAMCLLREIERQNNGPR